MKEGIHMWKCTSCGAENDGNASFCKDCGNPKPVPAAPLPDKEETPAAPAPQANVPAPEAQAPASPAPESPASPAAPATETPIPPYFPAPEMTAPVYAAAPAPKKRKSRWWIWLLVILGLLAAAAAVCYFTVHIWEPATCLTPNTCKICGKTEGAPLGHKAKDATCTKESVCSRCDAVLAPALGHDWQPATYEAPETCARCGATQGERKGFVAKKLEGYMSSEELKLNWNNKNDITHPYILDTPVDSCLRITLKLKITDYSGDIFGIWDLYGRDPYWGDWIYLDSFLVDESACGDEYVTYLFSLNMHPSFDALALVPYTDGNNQVSYTFIYKDVQRFEG